MPSPTRGEGAATGILCKSFKAGLFLSLPLVGRVAHRERSE
jgi:hypothetical protein